MEPDSLELILDWVRSRHFGKYRGMVVDNDDPTARGRLKVRVPAVLGALEIWAMPCVPYAGAGVGFLSLPAKDSGIWVEFEGGDPSFPIWTGCFWADDEAPEQGKAAVKIWKTDSLTVRLDDENDELLLQNGGDARVELGESITTEAGEAKLTVGSDGVVGEKGEKKLEVTTSSVRINDGALEVT